MVSAKVLCGIAGLLTGVLVTLYVLRLRSESDTEKYLSRVRGAGL